MILNWWLASSNINVIKSVLITFIAEPFFFFYYQLIRLMKCFPFVYLFVRSFILSKWIINCWNEWIKEVFQKSEIQYIHIFIICPFVHQLIIRFIHSFNKNIYHLSINSFIQLFPNPSSTYSSIYHSFWLSNKLIRVRIQ